MHTATTTVCLNAPSHIPAKVFVQLKKRSGPLVAEAVGNTYTQTIPPPPHQENAKKHLFIPCKSSAG